MTAAELRKKLDEGLKVDNSGKSTPMQRLTPFLHDLVTYLEENENQFTEGVIGQHETVSDRAMSQGDQPIATAVRHASNDPHTIAQVSSDAMTEVATPQTNSENGDASKATP